MLGVARYVSWCNSMDLNGQVCAPNLYYDPCPRMIYLIYVSIIYMQYILYVNIAYSDYIVTHNNLLFIVWVSEVMF